MRVPFCDNYVQGCTLFYGALVVTQPLAHAHLDLWIGRVTLFVFVFASAQGERNTRAFNHHNLGHIQRD